jgi:hypothetical protein
VRLFIARDEARQFRTRERHHPGARRLERGLARVEERKRHGRANERSPAAARRCHRHAHKRPANGHSARANGYPGSPDGDAPGPDRYPAHRCPTHGHAAGTDGSPANAHRPHQRAHRRDVQGWHPQRRHRQRRMLAPRWRRRLALQLATKGLILAMPTNRKVYHVEKNGDNWDVKLEGSARASAKAETQAGAIDRARDLAKAAPLGQVKVHRPDGRIRTEFTYGDDPNPPAG